ncbi:hypothetical protein EUGRSUZ_C04191 [Eucalyptus grandis]|uniref:Uncharacterized protein n=2 Tax=Eucalyptus grandis TaxID=71139 RepID=A0A059CX70_EUCGR|nr:hypothetical protein EUGRSUZ_C04191 [Eucalyptus grandis]
MGYSWFAKIALVLLCLLSGVVMVLKKNVSFSVETAKENFELALEADNSNTHARYWLAKLHLKYHVPGKCLAVGAALLVEAANMGDPDAQYELGCRLRVEHDYFSSDQQAFYYLEKAVDQLHPGALYLLGAVYLTGDCVKQDLASAMWCFHRASEKGHAGAAIAYGSLLLRGLFFEFMLLNKNKKCIRLYSLDYI